LFKIGASGERRRLKARSYDIIANSFSLLATRHSTRRALPYSILGFVAG
jgi:hypothetical protein